MIVARAAPFTPMPNPKIKIGSKMMLQTAPMVTVSILVFENPWAVMNMFMPNVIWTKIVPTA